MSHTYEGGRKSRASTLEARKASMTAKQDAGLVHLQMTSGQSVILSQVQEMHKK